MVDFIARKWYHFNKLNSESNRELDRKMILSGFFIPWQLKNLFIGSSNND